MSNKLPKTIIDKQGKTITLCWLPTSELANEYKTLEEFYEDIRNHAGKTPLLDIFDAEAIKNEDNLHLAKRLVQDALKGFEWWFGQYDRIVIKRTTQKLDSNDIEIKSGSHQTQCEELTSLVKDLWAKLIEYGKHSPEITAVIRARFDFLCIKHVFLEPFLKDEFGDGYGLQAKVHSDELIPKLQTCTELERIRKVFRELVYQGWIEEGAEILVNKRITNTLLHDPVSPETKKFNWLESLNVLKILTSRLDLPKRDIEKHFLNKGDTLNPRSLFSGGNPKDEIHSKMVNEILNRAGF